MCMTTSEFVESFHEYFNKRKFEEAIELMNNFLDNKYPGVCININFVIFSLVNLYRETNQFDKELELLKKYYDSSDPDPLVKFFGDRIQQLKNKESGCSSSENMLV